MSNLQVATAARKDPGVWKTLSYTPDPQIKEDLEGFVQRKRDNFRKQGRRHIDPALFDINFELTHGDQWLVTRIRYRGDTKEIEGSRSSSLVSYLKEEWPPALNLSDEALESLVPCMESYMMDALTQALRKSDSPVFQFGGPGRVDSD